jgi:hypothetical protein
MNSRSKGARGEREAAAILRVVFNAPCERCARNGISAADDVMSPLPGVRFEVKRAERIEFWRWWEQAVRDAGERMPVLLFRRNRSEWLIALELKALPTLAEKVMALLTEERRTDHAASPLSA